MWMHVLVTAWSGGLATSLARAAGGRGQDRVVLKGLVFCLSFALIWAAFHQTLVPRLQGTLASLTIEGDLAQNPAFAALRQYDRLAFEAIMQATRQSMRQGASKAQMAAVAAAHLELAVLPKIARASDPAVMRYMRVTLASVAELQRQGGDLCFQFLYPRRDAPLDTVEQLALITRAEGHAALAEVIRTSAISPQTPPSAADVQASLRYIASRMEQRHGADAEMLQDPESPKADKAKVCEMTLDMYQEIFQLPPDVQGKLLRFMLDTRTART